MFTLKTSAGARRFLSAVSVLLIVAVTLYASGVAPGAYNRILNAGSILTPRAVLNFASGGCVDNSGATPPETDCTMGTGTVNSGSAYQLATYAAAGTAVSGIQNINIGNGVTTNTYLPNVSYPVISFYNNQATGDIDLYTVPSGRRAVCTTAGFVTNPTASTGIAYAEFKSAGNYYTFNGTVTSLSSNVVGNGIAYNGTTNVLLSGESFAIHITITGVSGWFPCVEFDAAAALNRTAVIIPVSGDQVIYTSSGNSLPVNLGTFNVTATTLTYSFSLVPNGQTISANNKFQTGTQGTGLTVVTPKPTALIMANGDTIVFNDSAATARQGVWVTYIQL